MAYSDRVAVDAQTVNPDRAPRVALYILHINILWWTIASFIALVSILQLISYLHTKIAGRRRNSTGRVQDPEQAGSTRGRHLSLSRLPVAIINTYRIIAFRCNVGLGSYTLNLAEVFLTVGYIVMIFGLAFFNSMSFG